MKLVRSKSANKQFIKQLFKNNEEIKQTFKKITGDTTSYLQKVTLLKKLEVMINISPYNSKALIDCFCMEKWGLFMLMGDSNDIPWRTEALKIIRIAITFMINEQYEENKDRKHRASLTDLSKTLIFSKENLQYFVLDNYFIRVVVELLQTHKGHTLALSTLKDLCYLVQLTKEKEHLTETVQLASKLSTSSIIVNGLTDKNKITDQIKKMVKIEVRFVINKNITAPPGEKVVYIRILKPDDDVLIKSRSNVFVYENKEINYSSKRTVEYEGEELPVTIYWDIEEYLSPGTYRVDIFADGNLIGKKSFKWDK